MALVTAAGNRTAAGNPWTVSGTQAVPHDEETRPSLSLLKQNNGDRSTSHDVKQFVPLP